MLAFGNTYSLAILTLEIGRRYGDGGAARDSRERMRLLKTEIHIDVQAKHARTVCRAPEEI